MQLSFSGILSKEELHGEGKIQGQARREQVDEEDKNKGSISMSPEAQDPELPLGLMLCKVAALASLTLYRTPNSSR